MMCSANFKQIQTIVLMIIRGYLSKINWSAHRSQLNNLISLVLISDY